MKSPGTFLTIGFFIGIALPIITGTTEFSEEEVVLVHSKTISIFYPLAGVSVAILIYDWKNKWRGHEENLVTIGKLTYILAIVVLLEQLVELF